MTKRNLSDWASIAEIISALAVVSSLLYVGFEIQRNTKVGLASNRQAVAARAQELALCSGETQIDRLLFGPDDVAIALTEAEQDRVTAYIGALLRTTEEAFLLYRDGLLDEEYWMTRAGVMVAALRSEVLAMYMSKPGRLVSIQVISWPGRTSHLLTSTVSND
jgi:hypothetical protein